MAELLNIESIAPYECCVIAGISKYQNQKTKNSVTLTPDLDFVTNKVIFRVDCQCYCYVLCHQE